ncbi:MAG: response regulator transcription factor [Planctomycetes bacterium]|nr:response regulator transcription factor [Planctomycetota bacterium]MCB9870082.1 response regulator transcription factor [Planctomycetota bacterium]MCB9889517.1 response regulator transcription factor [Planctomycetota bacterium]
MTQEPPPTTVYLVDDETLIRAGFRAMLEQEGFQVIGESGDARQAIHAVKELRPDIVILDITMPGMSGIDAVAPIKQAAPRARILMASSHIGSQFLKQALQAGADGYVAKSSEPQELRLAIESILRGESYVSPKVASGLVGQIRGQGASAPGSSLDSLTAREREVFQLIAIGKANKEIAAELFLSLGTVKKHRENLQRKLDCHSAAELARLAIREGLLTL